MANYITIDGGTTNTRISLVKDNNVIDTIKLQIGAKASIDNNSLLKIEIKKAISQILKRNNFLEDNIDRILASGMITSEFGLCNLEHIATPAGIYELNKNMYEVVINEVSDIPFVFIRGVKTISDNLDKCDMMRGEETELMGIIRNDFGKCLYILPGSHSKLIFTDEDGRITYFTTTLTGEMIYSLSTGTILKDAVDMSVSEINSECLENGYTYCKEKGINEALFKVRVLKNVFKGTPIQCYSFFLGVVLCGEVTTILSSDVQKIVIGGRTQIKQAIAKLLEKHSNKEIICLSENSVNISTTLGMIRIYEMKG